MADPYATEAPDLGARPTGPAPWLEAVAERGGALIDAEGSFDAGAGFLAVHCVDNGVLAPVVRLEAAMAVLLWLEHAADPSGSPPAAELLRRLDDYGSPILAIKQGTVAGPGDRPGCVEVGAELVAAVLDAECGGSTIWERDPDFDYEVPAAVPGLAEPAARSLLPRLTYADHGRAYEHAALVVACKRARHERAAALTGLEPAVLAASGWPPQPSPWREQR